MMISILVALSSACNGNRLLNQLIIDSIDLMSGGQPGESNSPPVAAPEPHTRTPRVVYVRRDSETGPLVVITPEESLWYDVCFEFLPP